MFQILFNRDDFRPHWRLHNRRWLQVGWVSDIHRSILRKGKSQISNSSRVLLPKHSVSYRHVQLLHPFSCTASLPKCHWNCYIRFCCELGCNYDQSVKFLTITGEVFEKSMTIDLDGELSSLKSAYQNFYDLMVYYSRLLESRWLHRNFVVYV